MENFIGQIMMTGFGFAQKGFAMCNGQLLSIQQNQALFSLIGTTYGGNGVSNFQLPDLRGRTPNGRGPSPFGGVYNMGQIAGTETVTLSLSQLPQHTHFFAATTRPGTAQQPSASPGSYAQSTVGTGTENIYGEPNSGPLVPLLAASVSSVGGNQPHPNMQPFDVINFNIALQGQFPSRN